MTECWYRRILAGEHLLLACGWLAIPTTDAVILVEVDDTATLHAAVVQLWFHRAQLEVGLKGHGIGVAVVTGVTGRTGRTGLNWKSY